MVFIWFYVYSRACSMKGTLNMYNVVIRMQDEQDRNVGRFVIARYEQFIDAHMAATRFNETPAVYRSPMVLRIIYDVQGLYPNTMLVTTAVATKGIVVGGEDK
jgi:hypothetical protein